MKKLFSKEVIIGVSVIVAILILFIGIDYLKGINVFKPANYYMASYDNVAGLEISAPVTINGFKVGQVREINFNYEKPGKIDVVLAVNKSLHIPEDSRASIESTLMSGAYVEIQMGKSSKMMEVGGTLQGVTTPDMMANITQSVLPAVGSLVPKVDSLLTSLNTLVSDPALLKAVQSLGNVSDNISITSESLKNVMGRQVPALIGNANKVTNNIDSLTANLNTLSVQLKQLPISTSIDNVNELTANLAKFSSQLNDPNSSLGLLMNDAELYNRINRVAADVDSLLIDLQKNPKRYISIKLL
ncbi:MAG: MCE family protein [Bacteroides sp.]|nr:MCE family protein [Bacteroides sp.]